MKTTFTTQELKDLGFNSSILKMLHADTPKTVGTLDLEHNYQTRIYTHVYSAANIARDLTRTEDQLDVFYIWANKRKVQLPDSISMAITKAVSQAPRVVRRVYVEDAGVVEVTVRYPDGETRTEKAVGNELEGLKARLHNEGIFGVWTI